MIIEKQTSLIKQMNNSIVGLNEKINVLAGQHTNVFNQNNIIAKKPFAKAITSDDLIDLNEKAKDIDFAEKCSIYIFNKYSQFKEENKSGQTVALNIIDEFFDRNLLTQCSWSGLARSKNKDEVATKIAFGRFENIIELFFKSVKIFDTNYSYLNTKRFLKTQIKNSLQRAIGKNNRISSERTSRKKKEITVLNDDHNETSEVKDENNSSDEESESILSNEY